MSDSILRGIDAANPLGFLAALGTLRLLSLTQPGVKLHWISDGAWRPVVSALKDGDETSLAASLTKLPTIPMEQIGLLGKNITVPPSLFSQFTQAAAAATSLEDRRAADFAAAFGSEACKHEKLDRIQYTDFCFITGSGHQDFLETMKGLKSVIEPRHLEQTLFRPWQYNDKGLSLRWDPSDAREYALRWKDPGPEGAWTEWGANFLAIEALPFFSAHPGSKGLQTTGMSRLGRDECFTWPVWTEPLNRDSILSLVSLAQLQKADQQIDRNELTDMGIAAVYRAQRVRIGEGANFKVSFRPSRAI